MKYHQNKIGIKSQPSSDSDPNKACGIPHNGAVQEKSLTEVQRNMFGIACGKKKSIKSIRLKYHKKHLVCSIPSLPSTGDSRVRQREVESTTTTGNNPIKEEYDESLKLQEQLIESIKAIRLKYKKKANQPKYSLWFLNPDKVTSVQQDYESEQEMIQDAAQAAREGWEISKTPFEPGGLDVKEPERKNPERPQRGKPYKIAKKDPVTGEYSYEDEPQEPTSAYQNQPCPPGVTEKLTGCRPKNKHLSTEVKSLLNIRQKYRTSAKRFRRRMRKSIPGRSMVYIHSKDLEKARQMAEQKGLTFEHLGTKGNAEKIKLVGDDKAIDIVAKTFGKLLTSAR